MAFCLRAFGNEYIGMCIVGSERFPRKCASNSGGVGWNDLINRTF